MPMSALISVIVPVYKVEPYLHRCVESILKQTYTNLEIILVDDGSPDNVEKFVMNLPTQINAYKSYIKKTKDYQEPETADWILPRVNTLHL